MPVTITHVQTVTALVTRPTPATTPPNPLEVECTWQGLRYSLWLGLFLAQQLRRPDFQHELSRLLRDCDRELAELEIA